MLKLINDNEAFLTVRDKVVHDGGIGTLGEKTLHAVLKSYIEPNAKYREVKVGKSIADIFNGSEIIEIQTRSFIRLVKKLPLLLETAPVTIVLPLPHLKWVSWIDTESGETSKKRKSPKTGRPYDALYELSKIKKFLTDERLTIRILLIDMEEYRNLDGWGNGGKRGSSRNDRFPLALHSECVLKRPEDYLIFIPDNLGEEFTRKDYMKAAKLRDNHGTAGIDILRTMNLIYKSGTKGREHLYRRVNSTPT